MPLILAGLEPVRGSGSPSRGTKKISYDPARLPLLDSSRTYIASWVVTECMKEFGRLGKIATVDADLASTSGLEGGLS